MDHERDMVVNGGVEEEGRTACDGSDPRRSGGSGGEVSGSVSLEE
jgi:hypothetical protein